ncbi:MAG TPA: sugar phosphate nucleotidyltransferase, partial [Vicinamibacterales bacterium]|nr:sugar phosphate nucleotidyltransferase [Vicinamibacterales bacterium]
IQEDEPRGTAGALRMLAGHFTSPVFVTNCDVLLAINYRELLDFHAASGCVMTLAASLRNFRLPYGSCGIGPDGTLRDIEEKPELTRLVNTGLYAMNPGVFERIPADGPYNMTTLMTDLMETGDRVAVFPVSSEAWLDVGQWDEYRRATQLMTRGAAVPEDLL